VETFYLAAPGGVRTTEPFSQSARYASLDRNRESGVIRSVPHAFSADGGLAVLYGNIAEDGCIVKTAGVDASNLTFAGPARIFESQDDAVAAILGDKVLEGDVVVIRYEGPRGGPGMQEMLYPTSYLKSKGLGKACALITDGRFSGGSSGLSIGHISPEAAEGGALALIEEGDRIEIDIPKRSIGLAISDAELAARREVMLGKAEKAWKPAARARKISTALQAYAALATSAARGAVRDVNGGQRRPSHVAPVGPTVQQILKTGSMETQKTHEVRYDGVHCQLAIEQFSRGLVVVRISGSDVGEFGDAPLLELNECLAGTGTFELFIDARDVRGASVDVSSEWAGWLRAHKAQLREITMLTGSRFVQMTADFVRRFADLEGIMRVHTEPAVFDAALAESLERR
jgi:hypothetical protein